MASIHTSPSIRPMRRCPAPIRRSVAVLPPSTSPGTIEGSERSVDVTIQEHGWDSRAENGVAVIPRVWIVP